MPNINRHDHVIQKSECEPISEEPFHECQIEADTHSILMAFAMIGARRKEPALIEVDVKVEFALTRRELGGECTLIVLIERAIECTEVFLHLFVKCIELLFLHTAISVVRCLCRIQ